jgi:hypothetical protein
VTRALVAALLSTAMAAGAQAPEWPVSARPVATFGTTDGDTATELTGLTSATLLPDGGIVVGVGSGRDLRAIRWFRPGGALARSRGRRGRGPGEFAATPLVAAWAGDTVVAFDESQRAWAWYRNDGTLLRTQRDSTGRVIGARYGAAVVRGAVIVPRGARGVPPWAAAAMAQVARGDRRPTARWVRLDELGFLWVREAADRWSVVDSLGRFVGRVALPDGAALLDATRDAVLLATTDSDGFVVIERRALSRRPAAALPRQVAAPAPAPPVARERLAELRGALRNTATAQEMHWVKARSYTARPDTMPGFALDRMRVVVFGADARSWHGVVIDEASGTTCYVPVGVPILGIDEGNPTCSP